MTHALTLEITVPKGNNLKAVFRAISYSLRPMFTPPVEAKRRFIRLWRVPPLGVEDAAQRCPVKCF